MRLHSTSLCLGLAALLAAPAAHAASPQVYAAETSIYVDAGFMHTQYHENLVVGDDEDGYSPGFGVGFSSLTSTHASNPGALDLYTSLHYEFNGGSIQYAGHYQDGSLLYTHDRTIFQRIEARLGIGFPIIGGGESIPFFAAGWQSWNRNVDPVTGGSGEYYRTGLAGLGWKFDQPVGNVTLSVTPEFLGLVGGSVSFNGLPEGGRGFGVTPEERVELGVDDALGPHFHLFAKGFWEHFNYSGTHPFYFIFDGYNYGYVYEPFSTTTQFGLNVGAGYTFW